MKEDLNIGKLIKSNKDVDKDMSEESRKQLKKLRKLGLRRARYNLANPYVRTLKQVTEDEDKESASFYVRT